MPRKSSVTGVSGAVRIHRLSGVALAAMEAHGKRLDRTGEARAVHKGVPPITTTGLDLADLHAGHIAGCHVAKSHTKALHMILQFPTDLVNGEDGAAMLDHARVFAAETFGDAAIFADRVDRDEKSCHVVDLFLAPRYEKRTKRGSKEAVSTSRHLKALAEKHGRAPTLKGQGHALQDAWHAYMRDRMGLKVQRGEAKPQPGSDWQTPEQLEQERLAEQIAADRKAAEEARQERISEEQKRDMARQEATEARRELSAIREQVTAGEVLLAPVRASVAVYEAYLAEQARPLLEHWRTALGAVRSVFLHPAPSRWGFDLRALAVAVAHPDGAGFVSREWSPDPRKNLHDLKRLDIDPARLDAPDALRQTDRWPDLAGFDDLGLMVDLEDAQAADAGIVWPQPGNTSPPFRAHRAFLAVVVETFATALAKLDPTPAPIPADAKLAADMPEEVRRAIRPKPPSGPSGP